MKRLALLFAVGAELALGGCGGTGDDPPAVNQAPSMTAIAACLSAGTAEVTRERVEVSAGYGEVMAVAPDRGIFKIRVLEDPTEAPTERREVDAELNALANQGAGFGFTRVRAGGLVVAGLTARPPGSPDEPISKRTAVPSPADEELLDRCIGNP